MYCFDSLTSFRSFDSRTLLSWTEIRRVWRFQRGNMSP